MAYSIAGLLPSDSFHTVGVLALYCKVISILVSLHNVMVVVGDNSLLGIQNKETCLKSAGMHPLALHSNALEWTSCSSFRQYR